MTLDIHCTEQPRLYRGRSLVPVKELLSRLRDLIRGDFSLSSHEHPRRGVHHDFELKCLPSDAERVRRCTLLEYVFCHRA